MPTFSIESLLALNPASVAAFFLTVLVIGAVSWLSRYLRGVSPPLTQMEPTPASETQHLHAEPVMCGDITLEKLREFDGRDPSKPLYLACLGDVYDVTRGWDFYGPEGPYNKFAGREANRAFAKMSLNDSDCIPDIEGLTIPEMDVLRDWKAKFEGKYFKVGKVVKG